MRLETGTLAYSVGIATAIAWTICSALVALAPAPAMALTGSMFHVATSNASWSLTWGGYFAGLCVWTATGALFAALCAALYNKLCRQTVQG